MTVKTHKQLYYEREYGKYVCEFCDQTGVYWSQNEGAEGKALGPVVVHCQRHREQGRQSARSQLGLHLSLTRKPKIGETWEQMYEQEVRIWELFETLNS